MFMGLICNEIYISELEINPCVVEKGSGKVIALDAVVKIAKNVMPLAYL